MTITSLGTTTEARVADQLRDQILRGTLPLGSRLRQNDIAQRFEVSSTPVREALRQLAADGLVELDARRGATVRARSVTELLEVFDLLSLLEPTNLALAVPRLTIEDLAVARSTVEAMERTAELGPWSLLNRDFHLFLAERSGRPRTVRILRELLNIAAVHIHSELSVNRPRRVEGDDEHRALLKACETGDAEGARRECQDHFVPTLKFLNERIA